MSIKGMDNQHMIIRAPDFVKDVNTQMKSGERVHDAITTQHQQEAEHSQSMVIKSEESPKAELLLDNDGGGLGAGGGSSGKKAEEEETFDPLLDTALGHSEHIIDIML